MRGCAFLSLRTPAIKVNTLISEPSAANHILTSKGRFKPSGNLKKKKKGMKPATENYAATSKNEAGGGCNGHPPLRPPPSWKRGGTECIQSVVWALMCLLFPQVTAVFREIILNLA